MHRPSSITYLAYGMLGQGSASLGQVLENHWDSQGRYGRDANRRLGKKHNAFGMNAFVECVIDVFVFVFNSVGFGLSNFKKDIHI